MENHRGIREEAREVGVSELLPFGIASAKVLVLKERLVLARMHSEDPLLVPYSCWYSIRGSVLHIDSWHFVLKC